MPNYRRHRVAGGTYFFTLVTHQRRSWLCDPAARAALHQAIVSTRANWPFRIDAWVLLPDHLHCVWTLPDGETGYAERWRLIKTGVSRRLYADRTILPSASRSRRRESMLWQRRFWEHTICDEQDLAAHYAYVHYNPVKHGLCDSPGAWPYTTFHRFVRQGLYPPDWGVAEQVRIPDGVGSE
ncbi:MAG: transposase [Chitinivibrionales bacterium]|nr:transposase [Chitinivibrionales bacterium]